MTCYKIVVAYDGTDYHGWQIQPDATTISQILIDSFLSTFNQSISILGVSRTDAGVHALGQVAIVRCPINIPVSAVKSAWNNALPKDILIKHVVLLDELVHPHAGVVQKTYWYHFFLETPLPFFQRYGLHFNKSIDFVKLQRALQVFVGTHDFRSFCTGNESKDTVRTVDSAHVEFIEELQGYRIIIKGKGFLRYMVRRIVGACLMAASQKEMTLNDLSTILQAKNPCHTLPNAPAKGLVLYKVLYETRGDHEMVE